MSGHFLLAGGAEFGGRMADADRQALAAAGGSKAPVAIVPAAAAPDHNADRAGKNGVRWFRRLGAEQVVQLRALQMTAHGLAFVEKILECG